MPVINKKKRFSLKGICSPHINMEDLELPPPMNELEFATGEDLDKIGEVYGVGRHAASQWMESDQELRDRICAGLGVPKEFLNNKIRPDIDLTRIRV